MAKPKNRTTDSPLEALIGAVTRATDCLVTFEVSGPDADGFCAAYALWMRRHVDSGHLAETLLGAVASAAAGALNGVPLTDPQRLALRRELDLAAGASGVDADAILDRKNAPPPADGRRAD